MSVNKGSLPLATLLPCELTENEEMVPSVLKIRGLWQCGNIIVVSDFCPRPLAQPTLWAISSVCCAAGCPVSSFLGNYPL